MEEEINDSSDLRIFLDDLIPLCEEFSLLPPIGVMKNLSGTFSNSSSITLPSSFVIQFAARGTPSLAAKRILFPATYQCKLITVMS